MSSTSSSVALGAAATDQSRTAAVDGRQSFDGQSVGEIDIVVYNASADRSQGSVTEIYPDIVTSDMPLSAYVGFLVTQQAAMRVVPMSGATGSLVGFANSVLFAMGKFALRGFAQRATQGLGPKGVHVARVIIDALVRRELRPDPADNSDSTLDPDTITQT